jgi:hypothetical protein
MQRAFQTVVLISSVLALGLISCKRHTPLATEKLEETGALLLEQIQIADGTSDTREISAIVEGDGLSITKLRLAGVEPRFSSGTFWTVQLPSNNLADLVALPEVKMVKCTGPAERKSPPTNRPAASATKNKAAVAVGIIDTGINWRNSEYWQGDATRISSVWDQTTSKGHGPVTFSASYGTELKTDELRAERSAPSTAPMNSSQLVAMISGPATDNLVCIEKRSRAGALLRFRMRIISVHTTAATCLCVLSTRC